MKLDLHPLRLVGALQEELRLATFTLKEKGTARFSRAVGLSVAAVAACHLLVYSPPVKKLKRLDAKLKDAAATAQYADTYKEARARLEAVYSRLPGEKDRSQWLNSTIVDSLKAEDLIADSIQPPAENEVGGLVFQSVNVQLTARFDRLVRWLDRIEATKPAIHVSALSVAKKSGQLGAADVGVTLSTVIPKVRY